MFGPPFVLGEIYHRLFSAWVRIEPRCRSEDFRGGLEARTADPLWMLQRQWQMGEFKGEDVGSPIWIDIKYRTQMIDEIELGVDGATVDLPPNPPLAPPMEAVVEREYIEPSIMGLRTRVQIGLTFEQIVLARIPDRAQDILDMLKQDYFFKAPTRDDLEEIDEQSKRFLRVVTDRCIDGRKLLEAKEDGRLRTLLQQLDEAPGDLNEILTGILNDFNEWYGSLYTLPSDVDPSAWQPNMLDYTFKAKVPDVNTDTDEDIVFSAPSYRNGELDWYTFSVYQKPPEPDPALPGLEEVEPETARYPPVRVSFGGMPHARWWALEDNRTDFGDLEVAKTDLAKLMLMEFALIYGDDWFMVPLNLPMGSLTKIRQLDVTNVFGETSPPIPSARTPNTAPDDGWEMFSLTKVGRPIEPGEDDFLLIPPVVGHREESPPLEEVRFIRDEGANMVWAIETTVQNKIGDPVSGFDAQLERRNRDGGEAVPPPRPQLSDKPPFKLISTVPANWIPFIPVDSHGLFNSTYGSMKLQRAQMLRNEDAIAPKPIDSISRLLEMGKDRPLEWIEEEAVPRAGIKVQLTKQRVRWIDGKTYVWLGRKIVTGRGEGSSGLKFDFLVEDI